MLDRYGRKIDYVRMSITDLCNLRCVYCMPKEGVKKQCKDNILSYEEICHVSKQFAALGICKIKITGGEPLVRKDSAYLVSQLYNIQGIKEVTLTTNGVLLDEQVEDLYRAGIRNINVSLDSLQSETFAKITRSDHVHNVLRGIDHALQLGIQIKLNVLAMKGVNDHEVIDMVELSKDVPLHVRFIELMPIGLGRTMQRITEGELKRTIEARIGTLIAVDETLGNGPSVYYRLQGYKGSIGFISALSHTFCEGCNRVRLTADGFLKPCLQYETGLDIRPLLEGDEHILREEIKAVIFKKPRAHAFYESTDERKEQRLMSRIGG